MKAYVEFEILEGAYEISCPDALCSHQGIMDIELDIAALASSELVDKHKRFRLNRGKNFRYDKIYVHFVVFFSSFCLHSKHNVLICCFNIISLCYFCERWLIAFPVAKLNVIKFKTCFLFLLFVRMLCCGV